jgi:hypothetical protein
MTIANRDNPLDGSPSSQKKTYVPPQIFRVPLDPDQTILSACSLLTGSLANGGNRSCRGIGGGQCKNHRNRNGDSGPRPS